MSFIRQVMKNGTLYAFMGLFVVGGASIAQAQVFITPTIVGSDIQWQTSGVPASPNSNWCLAWGGASGYNGTPSSCFNFSTANPLISFNTEAGVITQAQNSFIYLQSCTGASTFPNGCIPDPAGNYSKVYYDGVTLVPDYSGDNSTRFIALAPPNGTTTATTSPLGALIHANPLNFQDVGAGYGRLHIHAVQDGAFACQNSGAVYDAVVTCSGDNVPVGPFDFDYGTSTISRLLSGDYDLRYPYTFPGGGKWNIEYDIQQVSSSFFGLFHSYTTILSTTTQITIGQLSPIDIVRTAVASSTAALNALTQQGIGAILASSTASFKAACNVFSGGFNMGDCITLAIWPGQQAISDDFDIIRQTPPWGYAFRFYDILVSTSTATTTLPKVTYTLSTSSPFYPNMTEISFDPLGTIVSSGDFISSVKSDQAQPLNLWQIVMPGVNVIVYLTLAFMVIKDLTSIHKHDDKGNTQHKDRNQKL